MCPASASTASGLDAAERSQGGVGGGLGGRQRPWPGWTGLGVSLMTGAVPCEFTLSAPHVSHDLLARVDRFETSVTPEVCSMVSASLPSRQP